MKWNRIQLVLRHKKENGSFKNLDADTRWTLLTRQSLKAGEGKKPTPDVFSLEAGTAGRALFKDLTTHSGSYTVPRSGDVEICKNSKLHGNHWKQWCARLFWIHQESGCCLLARQESRLEKKKKKIPLFVEVIKATVESFPTIVHHKYTSVLFWKLHQIHLSYLDISIFKSNENGLQF